MLFVDLDRFKLVNDRHGHAVGDEFVVLCEDLPRRKDADLVAARIMEAVARPIVLPGMEVSVTASVGIAFSGLSADLPAQLLSDADGAMYEAKRKGGGRHQVFDLRSRPTLTT